MTKKTLNVLELNNIDIYGKRFNGYDLVDYIDANEHDVSAKMIVNHKLSKSHNVVPLYPDGMEGADYKIERLEQRRGIKNQISIAEEALVRLPEYKKADILHFHMYHNMLLPIDFLLRIPADKKIILDLHDTFWLTDNKIPMLEVFRYADKNKAKLDEQRRQVLSKIDATLVLHSPMMADLSKKSMATKNLEDVRLIDFGIDTKIFRPLNKQRVLRKKYGIPEENIVLFCRAQKEFKGTDYIVAALKNTDFTRPITIMTVNGKGFFDEIAERYQVLDMETVADERKMVELYNLCDIFLAPSTEESFGFMAVEAMSCEKPVIVFDGTALPTTTGAPNIGYAVEPTSAALSNAIDYLIKKDAERLRRGKLGREMVRDKYNLKKYFEANLKLYRELGQKEKRQIDNGVKDYDKCRYRANKARYWWVRGENYAKQNLRRILK